MHQVHLLVSAWVDRQPDSCAVRDASTNRELTYRQLWQHAGHLADQLQARGVQPGDFVGLAMPRSVDLVVAMLATLRAGAAYLPLDAHAPADRIAMMLTEADVRVVVEAPQVGTAPGSAGFEARFARTSTGGAARPQPAERHPRSTDAPVGEVEHVRQRVRGQPRVRRVHVGLDRPAEGCRRPAPGGGPAGHVAQLLHDHARRPRRQLVQPGLRRDHVRGVEHAHRGRHARRAADGHGPSRWTAGWT